ncbi:hypothetical protein KQI48_11065 [Cellulomonas hominis]|uniref:hypothetical protein n=1 Tax=Cellulomonas hominis TaxID=156981 RepID=UPI001C0FB6F4|nr:hypothetical protein [Cellulomonas hominis]MBU5423205.1 hypothetical protein [Cellulomonas hominis]
MPDLTEVAADLYGVPPAEFTAARTAAVRAARAAGDKDLAAAVGSLRKPSAAAGAVNLLVRSRPEDLGRLLDLGVRLREAQAALAGADLRALHAEQQRAVPEVVDAALGLGAGGGAAVRGQVEATLRAAMGDPDAAAAVATGLLVRDLFSSGFEPVDVDGAVAVPDAPPLGGVPARRTPLRAVAPDREDDARQVPGGPAHRRRGRLITAEEPEPASGRVRAVPGGGGAGRPRRGAVRVAEDAGAGRGDRGAARDAERAAAREAERAAAREAERAARRAAARRAAEEDVALARREADERREARATAEARAADAEARLAELTEAADRARAEIARLREALGEAEQSARATGVELRHARSARTAAARAAERADARLEDAERALRDL